MKEEQIITEEDRLLLKRIYDYLNPNEYVRAVYISPAQQLRNSADELERKERDMILFGDLIRKITAFNLNQNDSH